MDDEFTDTRTANIARSPMRPSKDEVDAHIVTHTPYRDWCRHCVIGRGLNDQHRRGKSDFKVDDYPMITLDYGFLITKEVDTDGQ